MTSTSRTLCLLTMRGWWTQLSPKVHDMRPSRRTNAAPIQQGSRLLKILKTTEAVPDFDIRGIFGEVAKNDYDLAVLLARGFQGEAPRANATIAIARSILNQN